MKRDKTNDEEVYNKIVKTTEIESMAMYDNDEQLTPIMIDQSKPLQDGNGDVDNDPRDPALRKPNSEGEMTKTGQSAPIWTSFNELPR